MLKVEIPLVDKAMAYRECRLVISRSIRGIDLGFFHESFDDHMHLLFLSWLQRKNQG